MKFTTVRDIYDIFKKYPQINTDSRLSQTGSLFFALKGDNFDGNLFATKALDNGAAYAIIDNPEFALDERTLLVPDVLSCLQELASLHRESLSIPVIGITGTNGKTTTKELLAAALSTRFNTLATRGNLNNHIGVPLTLLSINSETEIAVIEMGANHIGEIESLCRIARPTHGLITNIGKAHLEGFGSPQGVIEAKNELYQHLLKSGGTAFINADNPLLMDLSKNIKRVLYGQNSNAEYQGEADATDGMLKVRLNSPIKTEIQTRLAGEYNFENAMAALAVAGYFKVDICNAAKAIADYQPKLNRSQIIESKYNTLILDAYNANPTSMEMALKNFASLEKKLKVIILGDMFELGEAAQAEHKHILYLATGYGFSAIFTAGRLFMNESADFKGIRAFADAGSLKKELIKKPLRNAMILIKGSRGMKLETLTDAL